MKILDYKGFEVNFHEHMDKFIAGVLSAPTWGELKKQLDATYKKNFKRTKVIFKGWHNYVFGEATSITEGGSVWITSSKGRSKEGSGTIYLDTSANRKLLDEITAISGRKEKMIEELNKERDDTISKMERYIKNN